METIDPLTNLLSGNRKKTLGVLSKAMSKATPPAGDTTAGVAMPAGDMTALPPGMQQGGLVLYNHHGYQEGGEILTSATNWINQNVLNPVKNFANNILPSLPQPALPTATPAPATLGTGLAAQVHNDQLKQAAGMGYAEGGEVKPLIPFSIADVANAARTVGNVAGRVAGDWYRGKMQEPTQASDIRHQTMPMHTQPGSLTAVPRVAGKGYAEGGEVTKPRPITDNEIAAKGYQKDVNGTYIKYRASSDADRARGIMAQSDHYPHRQAVEQDIRSLSFRATPGYAEGGEVMYGDIAGNVTTKRPMTLTENYGVHPRMSAGQITYTGRAQPVGEPSATTGQPARQPFRLSGAPSATQVPVNPRTGVPAVRSAGVPATTPQPNNLPAVRPATTPQVVQPAPRASAGSPTPRSGGNVPQRVNMAVARQGIADTIAPESPIRGYLPGGSATTPTPGEAVPTAEFGGAQPAMVGGGIAGELYRRSGLHIPGLEQMFGGEVDKSGMPLKSQAELLLHPLTPLPSHVPTATPAAQPTAAPQRTPIPNVTVNPQPADIAALPAAAATPAKRDMGNIYAEGNGLTMIGNPTAYQTPQLPGGGAINDWSPGSANEHLIASQAKYLDEVQHAVEANATQGIAPSFEQRKTLGLSGGDVAAILAANNKGGRFNTAIATNLEAGKAEGQKALTQSEINKNNAVAEYNRQHGENLGVGKDALIGTSTEGTPVYRSQKEGQYTLNENQEHVPYSGKVTKGMGASYQLNSEEQGAINAAISNHKLDPYKVNSRNGKVLAGIAMANPDMDLNDISAKLSVARNKDVIMKAGIAEIIPTLLKNAVETGKKLDYSDVQFAGKAEQWVQGQRNDPTFVEYMSQRNDLLLTLGQVMRGNGMTDMAQKLEEQASKPTMSPRALDGWLKGQMASVDPRIKMYRSLLAGRGITVPDNTPDSALEGATAAPAAAQPAVMWKRPGMNSVPMDAVNELKKDPSPKMRKYFDEAFGNGYAAAAIKD